MTVAAPQAPAIAPERLAFPVTDLASVADFAQWETEAVKERAAQLALKVGAAAVAETAKPGELGGEETSKEEFANLYEALLAAKQGSEAGLAFVDAALNTEAIEQVYKVGATEVELEVGEDGISQNGQSHAEMFAHALAFFCSSEETQARGQAEAFAGMLLSEARRTGWLKEYYFVTVSRFSDTMTDEQAAEAHLFVDTKTYSIQAVTEGRADKLALQSAFVAGKARPDAERHDKHAVERLMTVLGAPLFGEDDVATIAAPRLVHKSLMPNGVADLVKICDATTGTFWGEDKPPQDYNEFYVQCLQRGKGLATIVAKAKAELIAMADDFSPEDLMAPLRAVSGLLKDRLVPYVIRNHDIDARVYGREATPHILEAREAHVSGDAKRAERAEQKAVKKAVATGCPGVEAKLPNKESNDKKDKGDKEGKEKKKKKKSKREVLRCVHCPLCKRDGVDAYIDHDFNRQQKKITCSKCHQSKTYAM